MSQTHLTITMHKKVKPHYLAAQVTFVADRLRTAINICSRTEESAIMLSFMLQQRARHTSWLADQMERATASLGIADHQTVGGQRDLGS